MSNPITNARALLASRDATSKFAGYPDHKLADAMRELLAEVDRMRAEEARCIDAADAAVREDERRHAEFVKAAMERERRLEAERDKARAEVERLEAEVHRLRDVLNWVEVQCPGKCAGVIAAALEVPDAR